MTKIIYEFDSIEDSDDLIIYQNAKDMMMALFDLQDLARSIYKGYEKYDEDTVLEQLNDIIYKSKLDEIPWKKNVKKLLSTLKKTRKLGKSFLKKPREKLSQIRN